MFSEPSKREARKLRPPYRKVQRGSARCCFERGTEGAETHPPTIGMIRKMTSGKGFKRSSARGASPSRPDET